MVQMVLDPEENKLIHKKVSGNGYSSNRMEEIELGTIELTGTLAKEKVFENIQNQNDNFKLENF